MCAVCLQRKMFLSHPLEGPDVSEFCKHMLSDSCTNQNWSPWQLAMKHYGDRKVPKLVAAEKTRDMRELY